MPGVEVLGWVAPAEQPDFIPAEAPEEAPLIPVGWLFPASMFMPRREPGPLGAYIETAHETDEALPMRRETRMRAEEQSAALPVRTVLRYRLGVAEEEDSVPGAAYAVTRRSRRSEEDELLLGGRL